jgi:uncharacterized membrane protein
MLKAWTDRFGHSETALHLPSALGALLGIAFVWRLAARLWGERAGMLALALAGLNQIHVEEGNNARMYAMLFGAEAMTLWSLVRWLEEGRRRDLLWLALAGVIGLALHLLYMLTPLAIAIHLVRRRGNYPGRWRSALAAALVPIVSLAPLVVAWCMHQSQVGVASHWQAFEIDDALQKMSIIFTGSYKALDFKPTEYLGIALVVGAAALTLPKLWRREPSAVGDPVRHADLFWIWCLTPTLGMTLAALRSPGNQTIWRYLMMVGAAAPLLMTAAALRLAAGGRRRLAWTATSLFMLILIANTAAFLASPGPGLREVARHIAGDYRPDDGVIVSRTRNRSRAFVYYGPLRQKPPALPAGQMSADAIAAWVRRTAAGHPRFWAVFYQDLQKDPLYKALEGRREQFEPLGNVFVHGETAVRPYRLVAAGADNANTPANPSNRRRSYP